MSCGYGLVRLNDLTKSGSLLCPLQGGEPNKLVNIDKTDVRTNREGWRAVVKALTPSIKTCLKCEVFTKLDKKTIEDLSIMPSRVLINKPSLPFLKLYREYFGYRTICKKELDVNLPQDNTFK